MTSTTLTGEPLQHSQTRSTLRWLVLVFALLFAGPAGAIDYYVDNTCANAGDGLGPGCAATAGGAGAWTDLSAALLQLSAGDVLELQPGTYVGRFLISAGQGHNEGTAAAPITVRGTGIPDVVLQGNRVDRFTITLAQSWWILEELTVINGDGTGTVEPEGQVKVQGPAEGVIVRNLDVDGQNLSKAGVAVTCNPNGCPLETLLEDLTIHDQWLLQANASAPLYGDAHGVFIGNTTPGLPGVTGTIIRRVTTWHCDGDGVQINAPTDGSRTAAADTLIEECHFYRTDPYAREENGLDAKAPRGLIFRNNVVHGFRGTPTSVEGAAVLVHMGGYDAVIEGNEVYDCTNCIRVSRGAGTARPDNVRIENNLVHDTTTAALPIDSSTSGPTGNGVGIRVSLATNVVVAHNTLVSCEGTCIDIGADTEGVEVVNNVIVSGTGSEFGAVPADLLAGGEVDFHHNLLYDGVSSAPGRVNNQPIDLTDWPDSLAGDPLFVDAAGGDYHLQTGSPAIDAGLDVGTTADRDGNARDASPDFGAYEWAAGTGDDDDDSAGDDDDDDSVGDDDDDSAGEALLEGCSCNSQLGGAPGAGNGRGVLLFLLVCASALRARQRRAGFSTPA